MNPTLQFVEKWQLNRLMQMVCLLLLGGQVGLDLFVLLNCLAGGIDSWIIIEKVGINVIPKACLDHYNTLLNQEIRKSGRATADQSSTILLNDPFYELPNFGESRLLEFLS